MATFLDKTGATLAAMSVEAGAALKPRADTSAKGLPQAAAASVAALAKDTSSNSAHDRNFLYVDEARHLASSTPSGQGGELLRQIEAYQQGLFDRIAPSVVLLSTPKAFGSGFFVADDMILTNSHVVGNYQAADVILHDGRRLGGVVVERALEDVDLVLVRVPVKAPPLRLEEMSTLQVGSWVGSVGHGSGAVWTFNVGMVSNIYLDGTDRPVFQTQIPLNPGGSGGPIFDREGRVVGILTAGVTVFVDNAMLGKGPRLVVMATRGATYQVSAVIDGQLKRAAVRFPEVRAVTLP